MCRSVDAGIRLWVILWTACDWRFRSGSKATKDSLGAAVHSFILMTARSSANGQVIKCVLFGASRVVPKCTAALWKTVYVLKRGKFVLLVQEDGS